jgi:hypothetical protein
MSSKPETRADYHWLCCLQIRFLLNMRTLRLSAKDDGSVERAAGIIRAGGLVAFPTATSRHFLLKTGLSGASEKDF